MTSLKEAVVLITGAGGGFGSHLIQQCLAAGSTLILSDLRAEMLENATLSLSPTQKQRILQCLPADLSTRDGCEALHQAVQQTPDIVINNAGLACFGRFDELPAAQWERLMQVNLLAPMRLTSLFVPQMIARGSGHIVNISSVAGWVGTPGLGAYAASKFGLRGFGESLSQELKPHGIRVTTVYPFFSKTPILESPQYGSLRGQNLPDSMITDPQKVIQEVIRGIEQDSVHVFPDATARRLHWVKRLAPWLIPILNRRASLTE